MENLTTKGKVIAVFMSFMLAFSMIPGVSAFAGDEPGEGIEQVESSVQVEQDASAQTGSTGLTASAKSGMAPQDLPERDPQKLTDVISDVKIVDSLGGVQNPESDGVIYISVNTKYRYQVDFDLSKYNDNLVNGDYFTFIIPAPVHIPSKDVDLTIKFTDPKTGVEIATGLITPNGTAGGGSVKITLQNLEEYLAKTGGETIKDVKGTFYTIFQITEEVTEKVITFETEEIINKVTHRLTAKKAEEQDYTGRIGETNFEKRADRTSSDPIVSEALGKTVNYSASWYGRINVKQASYDKIIITDTIDVSEHAPMQFIPEKLRLYTGYFGTTDYDFKYDDYDAPLEEGKDYTIEYSESYTKFVLTITNPSQFTAANGKPAAFWLSYSTSITNDGAAVYNSLEMTGGSQVLRQTNEDSKTESVVEKSVRTTTGGTISIDTSYSITLYKVDSETMEPLPGAVFKVKMPSGDEITLDATDENGRTQSRQFSTDELGDGKFTVVEVTAPDGYKLDSNPFEVTVGKDGAIRTVTNEPQDASGSIVLEGTKKLSGRALKAGEFTFTVKEGDKTVATGKNAADGSIAFTKIEYTRKDAGTHTYTITEDKAGTTENGVTYSTQSFEVSVEVTNEGNGVLSAKPTYPTSGVVFENTYTTDSTKIGLVATKSLTGRELREGEFSFTVREGETTVATGTNAADGSIAFTEIAYTLDDVGVHTYTITEDNAGTTANGVTYDSASFQVTVDVKDNGDGTLSAATTYPADGIAFKNAYEPSGDATLQAKKSLTGRDLKADEFSFELRDEGGALLETVSNGADGNVAFSAISYDKAGEYKYTISEAAGSAGGVTYDSKTVNVTVSVTDDGKGDLSATVTYDGAAAIPEFSNAYAATGSATLEGTKSLTGRELREGEFSFTVKEGETTVATGTNAADGSIAFTEIAYTLDDVGTHVYTVSEDAGGMADITYDGRTFEVSVAVSDKGDGTLEAEATYPEGGVAFENAYEIVDVSVTKVWVGGEGGPVTVRLHADGAEADSKAITAADGWTATFSGLPKYSADDGHEIAYTVTEDEVDGYLSEVTGSAAEGFTVTNTKKEVKGEDREDPDEPEDGDDEDEEEPEEDDSDDGTVGSPSGSGKDGGSYVSTGDGSEIAAFAAAAAAAVAAAGGIAVVRRRNDSA